MKALKRADKLLAGAILIVAGAVAGINPKWELRKLWKRDDPKADSEGEETQVLY